MVIYFVYGLAFGGLGLAAFLQFRREGDFPLKRHLQWLAAFGFAGAGAAWLDMFLVSSTMPEAAALLKTLRLLLQALSGLLLLKFGWNILVRLTPLPGWVVFIPGVLIVPAAFVITYAATTFITPSPIGIPIDIWSRYLLYLPGSIMAGIGFLHQAYVQRKAGLPDVSNLMLGAGIAFLFEAFVVGLVVPAAPYGPASYYNYDRTAYTAFASEQIEVSRAFGLTAWLDYQQVLETTGLPIQFWRTLSAIAVTFFVVRGLDVFDAIQQRKMRALQEERDRAHHLAFEAQIVARQTAESWTDALVGISRQIAELDDMDNILLYIVHQARVLLRADFAGLALWSGEQPQLELKCCAGQAHTGMVQQPQIVANPLILDVALSSRPYCSHEQEAPERLRQVCGAPPGDAGAVAAVPLQLDSRSIGAFWIARDLPQLFSDTDLIWLECLADQVVIAIKHGLMTSQLQSVSVIEERTRIAREMHDGLAQVLGYLNLEVQTLGVLLQQGKQDKFQTKLEQMRAAIQTAHADVRENILSLRTTLGNEQGLVPAIAEYLAEFGIQTRIATHFDDRLDTAAQLSSVAEVQLVCILQEALTNVRKHAQARQVRVSLTSRGDGEEGEEGAEVVLRVQDDGVGIDSSASRRSFGLQTMRERARSVGGELTILSAPGAGTRLECRLPCVRQDRLARKSLVIQ